MNFDIHKYKLAIANESDQVGYARAKKELETAIASSPIEQAIELKQLRMPEVVFRLELDGLNKAGFDMDKQRYFGEHYEYECLILAFHARWSWAKKNHPTLAVRYDMSDYPLEVAV
jgi:hypothetical protein